MKINYYIKYFYRNKGSETLFKYFILSRIPNLNFKKKNLQTI